MEKRRVVITGVGLISPLGIGTKPNWEALLAGRNGIGPITRFDATEYASRIAGEVRGFEPTDFIDKREIRRMDIFIQYAIAASYFAMEDAGLKIAPEEAPRAGVIIGSGIGGLNVLEATQTALLQGGPRKISPFFIPSLIINLAAGHVSIKYGAKGPNSAPCTACSTGSHAIGDSYRIIQYGDADIMITGGTESVVSPLGIGGFCSMKALSTRNDHPETASSPFDAERDGFVMSEGAGILILEELGHAVRRNAQIYAEIVGYGMTADAYHITAPSEDGDGAVRVMQAALRDAGVSPAEVDYINAHGTSTPYNDKTETMAIKKAFGEYARKVAISSTKSMTGHMLGAAGGFEAGVSAMAIRDSWIPPTTNLQHPDPECDLDYVPNTARQASIRYALSNSFGFGGTNACLLFKRYEA